MATMYPGSFTGGPQSERRVWEALSKLDAEWCVFHSVAWQAMRGKRQADGEADFVLVHPRAGVLLLEVKGGEISVDSGNWLSKDRWGSVFSIKSPFRQAVSSKYALRSYLEQRESSLAGVPFLHAVVLPDVAIKDDLGPDAPRVLVMDGADVSDASAAISRIVRHWEPDARLLPHQIKNITDLLAPTLEAKTRLRNKLAEVSEQILRLTEQQIQVLSGLRRQRRATIYGGAGTGKTVLSIQRARRLREDGFKVLWTCFNQPLSEYVSISLAGEDIQVQHFHSLVAEQAKRAGIAFPPSPDEDWWDRESAQLLVSAAAANSFSFDALVIDEAQDFSNDMIAALLLLLSDPENGPVSTFADSHQAIYRPGWALPSDWPPFELTTNCRNTSQIARRVASIFGDEEISPGANGPEPELQICDSEADAISVVQRTVDHLTQNELIDPGQITVLCGRRTVLDKLRALGFAQPRPSDIRQVGVTSETIHRFKGLEADVIIVVLAGLSLDDPFERSLAYIAMSRPRGMLYVIGPRGVKKQLGW